MTAKKKTIGMFAPFINILTYLVIIGLVVIMLYGNAIKEKYLTGEDVKINLSSFIGYLPQNDEGSPNGVVYYMIFGDRVEPQGIVLMITLFASCVGIAMALWRLVVTLPVTVKYIVMKLKKHEFSWYYVLIFPLLIVYLVNLRGVPISDTFASAEAERSYHEACSQSGGSKIANIIASAVVALFAVGSLVLYLITYGITIDGELFQVLHGFFTSIFSVGLAGQWGQYADGPYVVLGSYAIISAFAVLSLLTTAIDK